MDMIGVLSFLFLASSCSSSVIPLALVPDVVLKERPFCLLDKKPEMSSFLQKNFGDCNFTVPAKVGQFTRNRETALCFGFYDSVFELCEKSMFENFMKTEPKMDLTSLCPTAKTSFENVVYKFNDTKLNEWLGAFKDIMTDPEKCSVACTFNGEMDAVCSTAVAAVKFLNDAKVVESDKKSPEDTKPAGSVVAADTETAVNAASSEPSNDATVNENPPPPVESNAAPSKPLDTVEDKKLEKDEKETPAQVHPESSNKEKESHNDPPNLEDNIDDLGLDKMKETDKTDLEEEKQPIQTDEGSQQVDAPVEDEDSLLDTLAKPNPKLEEPVVTNTISDHFVEAEDSNFFSYFAMMTVACIFAYVFFHNKNKILALALEGRKQRSARGKGRHSSTNYSKLHSNLEEAIASNTTSPSSTHVLY